MITVIQNEKDKSKMDATAQSNGQRQKVISYRKTSYKSWLYGCRFLNYGTVDTHTSMFYSRVYMCNDTSSCQKTVEPSAITTQWVDSMDHTLHKLFIIKKAPIKGPILFTSVFTFLHTSTRLSFLSYCLTFLSISHFVTNSCR